MTPQAQEQQQQQQSWNQEPSSSSSNPTASAPASAPEPSDAASSSSLSLSEAEVAQVKSGIASALSGVDAAHHEYTGASLYYDASTMASLNPFSLVGPFKFLCFSFVCSFKYIYIYISILDAKPILLTLHRPPSTDSECIDLLRSRCGMRCPRASGRPSWCSCLRIDGAT